ncbi:MAG TPA: helix-turn-helix transcriptional regulator [Solirubrobacterales bacterium]
MRKQRRISDEAAVVLALFLSTPEKSRYGREIVIETGIKSGSLYPILQRFEDRDLLESSWEELEQAVADKRRPRRLYRLRIKSTERAEELLDEWRREGAGSRTRIGRELPA